MVRKLANRSPKKLTQIQRTLSVSRHLLATSWRSIWLQRRLFGGIVAINIIVNLALMWMTGPALQPIYQSLWFVFVSCTLIWTARHLEAKTLPTVRQAYWDGSAGALKFMVVLAVLVLVGIPLTVGAFIFGTLSWLVSANVLLKTASALAWIAFSLLSLLLLSRLILSLPVVTLPQIGPFQAVGTSWRLSRGLGLKIAWRLFVLFVLTILAAGMVNFGVTALPFNNEVGIIVTQILAWGLIMPYVYVYIFQIYREVS